MSLATLYGLPMERIELGSPAESSRRRHLSLARELSARALASGLKITVIISSPPVPPGGASSPTLSLADIGALIATMNDTALGASLGVSVTALAPTQETVTVITEAECPRGYWYASGGSPPIAFARVSLARPRIV